MDDIFDDEAPEISVMSRDWQKIKTARFKDGFVAGASQGQDETLQCGFNKGYKHGLASSFMISKIRGVLGALLAYHAAYEGNPITDDVIMETEQILEDINKLEAESVADELFGMSMQQTNCTKCNCTESTQNNAEMSNLSLNASANNDPDSMEIDQNVTANCTKMTDRCSGGCNNKPRNETQLNSPETFDVKTVNRLLSQSPAIMDIIIRSKHTLKKLKWTDEMIESLL